MAKVIVIGPNGFTLRNYKTKIALKGSGFKWDGLGGKDSPILTSLG